MKPIFQIDIAAYTLLVQGMNQQYFVEKKGNMSDFSLYYDDLWLSDSAVIDNVYKSKGEWKIDLIFAHIHNPLKFIKRYITSHPCPKRAAQKAEFMRRIAAKDQRGTLHIESSYFNVCDN